MRLDYPATVWYKSLVFPEVDDAESVWWLIADRNTAETIFSSYRK
jgi:hypothetical protein